MKARVEAAKTLPDAFRPAHHLDSESDWEGVPVTVRGQAGLVRGAVKEGGVVRLFVSTQNWSAWMTPMDVETMTDHSQELIGESEPEGGWVTAPQLLTSEIYTLVLCKYSGEKAEKFICTYRERRLHPDEPCLTFYHQANALASGFIDASTFTDDMLPPSERVTVSPSGEPTYEGVLEP